MHCGKVVSMPYKPRDVLYAYGALMITMQFKGNSLIPCSAFILRFCAQVMEGTKFTKSKKQNSPFKVPIYTTFITYRDISVMGHRWITDDKSHLVIFSQLLLHNIWHKHQIELCTIIRHIIES